MCVLYGLWELLFLNLPAPLPGWISSETTKPGKFHSVRLGCLVFVLAVHTSVVALSLPCEILMLENEHALYAELLYCPKMNSPKDLTYGRQQL